MEIARTLVVLHIEEGNVECYSDDVPICMLFKLIAQGVHIIKVHVEEYIYIYIYNYWHATMMRPAIRPFLALDL